jgi:hypothetical protein
MWVLATTRALIACSLLVMATLSSRLYLPDRSHSDMYSEQDSPPQWNYVDGCVRCWRNFGGAFLCRKEILKLSCFSNQVLW